MSIGALDYSCDVVVLILKFESSCYKTHSHVDRSLKSSGEEYHITLSSVGGSALLMMEGAPKVRPFIVDAWA